MLKSESSQAFWNSLGELGFRFDACVHKASAWLGTTPLGTMQMAQKIPSRTDLSRRLILPALAAAATLLFAPPAYGEDCNENGVDDRIDVVLHTSPDCNSNFRPDECDVLDGTSEDSDHNGIPDACDVDCDGNGISDDLDLANGNHQDCNLNQIPDVCDIENGVARDRNENAIPDVCEPDCNNNAIPDDEDIRTGFSQDTDGNLVPDACDRAPRFRLIDLGASAGLASGATGLNNSGAVVGWTTFCCPFNPETSSTLALVHGMLWQRGTMTDLGAVAWGSPPCSTLGCQSRMYDINGCGEAVGDTQGPAGRLPVVWLPYDRGSLSRGLNLLPMPSHPAYFASGRAQAINEKGQIVGYVGASNAQRAVLWEFDGDAYAVRILGTLTSGAGWGLASDINDRGQVVGLSVGLTNKLEAFLWLPEASHGLSSGIRSLTPGLDNSPPSINNHGEVVGQAQEPWIWLPDAAHTMPSGFSWIGAPTAWIFPSMINDAGQIAASALRLELGDEARIVQRAMLWQDGTWLLLGDHVMDAGDWDLHTATAINSDGQIVGYAIHHLPAASDSQSLAGRGYLLMRLHGQANPSRSYPMAVGEFNSVGHSGPAKGSCPAQSR